MKRMFGRALSALRRPVDTLRIWPTAYVTQLSRRLTTHDSRSVVSIIDARVAKGERQLTELGKLLLESRRRIEHSGIAMLNRQQLDSERAERRGGVSRQ
jgi:hypothetical protein